MEGGGASTPPGEGGFSSRLSRALPILRWGRTYRPATLAEDGIAALIVAAMLVPQALAYALLAGLPAQVGLYASVLPLLAYALFGTSRALAVGPVAVISLMTASALGDIAPPGTGEYVAAALVLALMSGVFLVALGVFRLGFLGHFLSHPVIAGFVTATALLIAASQFQHLVGIEGSGTTLYEMLTNLAARLPDADVATAAVGGGAVAALLAARAGLATLLTRLGASARAADLATKLAPLAVVVVTTAAAAAFDLAGRGVDILGDIPSGLPPLTTPSFAPDIWLQLAGAAVLVSIVGFAESLSVAQTLAARRRERVDPDQELVGLGASNIAASFTGGYPVTGGFSRSVVAFDAGARTPAAGALTAICVALVAWSLTPLLYYLPRATLAAIIIVAVMSLFDFRAILRTWRYSGRDFAAVAITIGTTVIAGVEVGLLAGVAASIALYLYRTSKPHIAVVGLVPGTEHFRNVSRHEVVTSPEVLSLRVDESLYFANARFLEDRVTELVSERPTTRHVVLQCAAINEIDASALESLRSMNERLSARGVSLHLSEVKGPVMDALQRTELLGELTGRAYLTHYGALADLAPDVVARGGREAP